MEPKIIEKDEITLVGIVTQGGDIGTMWEEFIANEELIQHTVKDVGYELHAYPKDFTWGDPYYIIVGVEVTKIEALPDIMFAKVLPPCKYAVFTHRLGDGGYEGVNEPIDEWMKTAPYERVHEFDLQVYDDRFIGPDDPDSVLDFFIPVKPK